MGFPEKSVSQRLIHWEAACVAARAAVQAAQSLGVRVNVAVVDAGGNLAAFLRMPGAPLHSIDIAIDKAYTSVSFGLPTSKWSSVLQEHSEAVRQGIVLRPRFIAFGGGLPIFFAGELAGAIGVSGATEEQDEMCARAGLQAIDADQL